MVADCPYSGRRGAMCQTWLGKTLDIMVFPEYSHGGALSSVNERSFCLLVHNVLPANFLCSDSD